MTPGDFFLALIHEWTPFAWAVGNILRDKQGICRPFDRFLVALLDASAGGSVDLGNDVCGDPWGPIEAEAAPTPPNSSRARQSLNKLTSPRQLSEELL